MEASFDCRVQRHRRALPGRGERQPRRDRESASPSAAVRWFNAHDFLSTTLDDGQARRKRAILMLLRALLHDLKASAGTAPAARLASQHAGLSRGGGPHSEMSVR